VNIAVRITSGRGAIFVLDVVDAELRLQRGGVAEAPAEIEADQHVAFIAQPVLVGQEQERDRIAVPSVERPVRPAQYHRLPEREIQFPAEPGTDPVGKEVAMDVTTSNPKVGRG
jgi:hypothetical protein